MSIIHDKVGVSLLFSDQFKPRCSYKTVLEKRLSEQITNATLRHPTKNSHDSDPGEGGERGKLPTFWGGDARRKISKEPLRDINLGVAQVDFKP